MQSIIKRKEMYLIEKIYTYKLALPIVKYLANTFITPNMITILNLFLGLVSIILLLMNINLPVALLVQIYLLFDILDGNLARYAGKTSKFGAKLDNFCDRLCYNGFIFAAGYNRVITEVLIIALLLHNLHGIVATFYILPRIRKLKKVKRFGLKKVLMTKGIILGMDLSTLDFLLSVCIIINKLDIFVIVILVAYLVDILYRLVELRINMAIEKES
jgi:phosphatidylglycerophosphate synthase